MRLDKYIADNYTLPRNRVKELIKKKKVSVNGVACTKPAYIVGESDTVEVELIETLRYVARSAGKLEKFLDDIELSVANMVVYDVGASTGGFSQICLERWAKKVYAIDVGTDQLHESIKGDERVVDISPMDIRDEKLPKLLEDEPGLILVDVAFISLRKIIPTIKGFCNVNTKVILLFKPQFEVGKEYINHRWVVKTREIAEKFLVDFKKHLQTEGFTISRTDISSVRGESGNQEYMIYAQIK